MNPREYPDDLPETDRLQCMFDELVFGTSFVEETPEGPRRLDPTEEVRIYE